MYIIKMPADFNPAAFWIMVALFTALGVTSIVEGNKPQATKGENYFGILYLVFAVGMVLYKMMGH